MSWLYLVFFISCTASPSRDFERISGPQSLADSQGIPVVTAISGETYYVEHGVSFPLYGVGAEFAIQSRLSGDVGVSWIVSSSQEESLEIYQSPSESSIAPVKLKSIAIHEGINQIFFQTDLGAGDTLRAQCQTGNRLIISKPIVFRIIPPEKRRYVFLISVDTLSALHLSLYGYERHLTPHLESLAQDGVLFSQAYANSSWTVSSHMSLFTALFEHRHRVKVAKSYTGDTEADYIQERRYIFSLPNSIPSLIEHLSQDYVTLSLNGGGNVSPNFGFFRGFDFSQSRDSDMNDPRAAENLFSNVQKSIDTHPFPKVFYFLHTYHVHMPYNPDEEFLMRLDHKARLKSFDFYSDLGGTRQIYRNFPEDVRQDVITLYDAEIMGFDKFFGDFIDSLKAQRLYDNSFIILLSDHGEAFMEHESWAHATDVYNEQVRVPLIMKFPNQAFGGTVIPGNVSLVDVLPTLLDYIGTEVPEALDGASFMGAVRGGRLEERTIVSSLFRSKAFSFLPGKLALIQGDAKLIFNEAELEQTQRFFSPPPPVVSRIERYDLRTDPHEEVNLINEAARSDKISRLYAKLLKTVEEMKENSIESSEAEKKRMPPELIEQLKALGYIK
jgi:choline-sulfatase